MKNRIALIGILVENKSVTDKINDLLHQYGEYIIGRMGLPHRERDISIISIVIDAPNEIISSLSGKLGMIDGISVSAVYSKVKDKE
ncbi:MAG: iron-only hydrogenase system regulator [Clostridia bacterium]|nr:iron-only hydrogenase system regulator [Clostridia bacterium]